MIADCTTRFVMKLLILQVAWVHQYLPISIMHDLKISFFRVLRLGIVHPLKLELMHLITPRILWGGGGSKSLNSVTVMMI